LQQISSFQPVVVGTSQKNRRNIGDLTERQKRKYFFCYRTTSGASAPSVFHGHLTAKFILSVAGLVIGDKRLS